MASWVDAHRVPRHPGAGARQEISYKPERTSRGSRHGNSRSCIATLKSVKAAFGDSAAKFRRDGSNHAAEMAGSAGSRIPQELRRRYSHGGGQDQSIPPRNFECTLGWHIVIVGKSGPPRPARIRGDEEELSGLLESQWREKAAAADLQKLRAEARLSFSIGPCGRHAGMTFPTYVLNFRACE